MTRKMDKKVDCKIEKPIFFQYFVALVLFYQHAPVPTAATLRNNLLNHICYNKKRLAMTYSSLLLQGLSEKVRMILLLS